MDEIKIINRIGILLSWPRELDMYKVLIENMPGDLVIIVDDFTYTEVGVCSPIKSNWKNKIQCALQHSSNIS